MERRTSWGDEWTRFYTQGWRSVSTLVHGHRVQCVFVSLVQTIFLPLSGMRPVRKGKEVSLHLLGLAGHRTLLLEPPGMDRPLSGRSRALTWHSCALALVYPASLFHCSRHKRSTYETHVVRSILWAMHSTAAIHNLNHLKRPSGSVYRSCLPATTTAYS